MTSTREMVDMEQALERLTEYVAEVLLRIGQRRLSQARIVDRVLSDRVEEELVGWLERRAKPIVEDLNQL